MVDPVTTPPIDLAVSIGSLRLKNPIMVASGTFGYAEEARPFVTLDRLGAVVPKTITGLPRQGNPPPRIAETPAGMLNSIGLDNDGIEHFLIHHLPVLREANTAIIANVAGKSVAEFVALAQRLADIEEIAALELNLSCPNVAGGTDYATDPALTARVVEGVRSVFTRPVLAKLTPNVTDVCQIARSAGEAGADGVTLINTVLATALDWRRQRPILANVYGGLSGPAIKPIALRIVMQVAQAVKIPIIGVGGIGTIDDVMEFLVAGASAVQVGTANFYDPGVPIRLLDQLPGALSQLGAQNVPQIVGSIRLSVQ